MISRRTSSIPKADVVFSRLLYCDSRYSETCCRHSEAYRRHSQASHWRCQARRRRSQACRQRSQALPGAPKVLSGAPRCFQTYHNHSNGTPVPVIRDPSYSEGLLECPPMVWYSPEIDISKFTLHILSDTPGGSQWLKYILLMISSGWLWLCLLHCPSLTNHRSHHLHHHHIHCWKALAMGASVQSLQHLFFTVPLAAGIFLLEG